VNYSKLPQFSRYAAEDKLIHYVILALVTFLVYGVTREHLAFKIPKWSRNLFRWKTTSRVVDYSKLPQFKKYDVENGFLLDLREGDSIEFTVDAALTYAHPLHKRTLGRKILDALVRDLPPYQHTPSLAKILIVFPRVRSVRWISRTMPPTVDADGTIDYGSIDCFTVEGDRSHLSGSWGEIEIVSDPVEVSEIDES
jgi:hypothetical protein